MKKYVKNITNFATVTLPGSAVYGGSSIQDLVFKYLNNLLVPILVGVGLGSIIYGGVKYIMAEGDAGKAAEARKIILISVIGVVLIGISAVIINWVSSFWGEVLI